MSEYPKHICYRLGGFGKQMHGVARSPREEQVLRKHIDENGHDLKVAQPVAEMEDKARRQFVELEDIGYRKNYFDDDPELPF